MDDNEDKLTGTATKPGDRASEVAEDLQTRPKTAWNAVQHRTNCAVRERSAYVRKHPVPTALAAFGFGLVVGLFLIRHQPVSFKDRYISGPLHQSRGLLLGVLVACGTLLRRTFLSGSSAAEETAGNVAGHLQDALKPLREAARKTGRKVGL